MTPAAPQTTALTPEIKVGLTDEPTVLYRLYAADGRLLYVGITGNLGARFRAHSCRSPWWHMVARRTVMLYSARTVARKAETLAIHSEHPAFNVQRPEPGRPKTRKVATAPPRKRCVYPGSRVPALRALSRARTCAGLSLLQAARECTERGAPLTVTALAKFERGQALPRPRVVPVLADVLGVEPDVVAYAYARLREAARAA